MLISSLCDYSDAYIFAEGTITITGEKGAGEAAARQAPREADKRSKEAIFKNCGPFTGCISEINNVQVDNAKHLDLVIQMYSLIEYSDNYSKISGSYGNTTEMNQLKHMLTLLFIFLLMTITVFFLSLKKK